MVLETCFVSVGHINCLPLSILTVKIFFWQQCLREENTNLYFQSL